MKKIFSSFLGLTATSAQHATGPGGPFDQEANKMVKSGLDGGQPTHLRELVEAVAEAAAEPRYTRLKQMWTQHHRMEPVATVPVYVGLYILPDDYPVIWQELIPPETLVSLDPLERDIELQLRKKLYKHHNIPDDDVLTPTVWVRPVHSRADKRPKDVDRTSSQYQEHAEDDNSARLWGLPQRIRETATPGGAYKVKPVVANEADMSLIRHPRYEVDKAATRVVLERARDLVGGHLPVQLATDEVGFNPSEIVVALMGIEAVLYGVKDRPEFIHRMMDIATEGSIAYHREREAAGAVSAEATWYYRAHWEDLLEDAPPDRLSSSWTNISAQSLCGLSPAMYAEFLQPYHARLAALAGEGRVYYHGCENLTSKFSIIRELPNLRRIHISPWSDLEVAVEILGAEFVLETEVHTADTIFVHDAAEMRASVERLISIADGCVMDVQLTAIETVATRPTVLGNWARIAQEVTARYS